MIRYVTSKPTNLNGKEMSMFSMRRSLNERSRVSVNASRALAMLRPDLSVKIKCFAKKNYEQNFLAKVLINDKVEVKLAQ